MGAPDFRKHLDERVRSAEFELVRAVEEMADAADDPALVLAMARFDVRRDALNELLMARRVMEELGVIA